MGLFENFFNQRSHCNPWDSDPGTDLGHTAFKIS